MCYETPTTHMPGTKCPRNNSGSLALRGYLHRTGTSDSGNLSALSTASSLSGQGSICGVQLPLCRGEKMCHLWKLSLKGMRLPSLSHPLWTGALRILHARSQVLSFTQLSAIGILTLCSNRRVGAGSHPPVLVLELSSPGTHPGGSSWKSIRPAVLNLGSRFCIPFVNKRVTWFNFPYGNLVHCRNPSFLIKHFGRVLP